MSIQLPDLNNKYDDVNDNRMYIKRTDGNTFFMSNSVYGGILINCGNPLKRNVLLDVNAGANGFLVLFGNGATSSNGRTLLGLDTDDNKFTLTSKSKYNGCAGATQTTVTIRSQEVTLDNCEWVYVEKVYDSVAGLYDWRLNLIASDGTITYGDTVSSLLCGIQTHDVNYTNHYLGGIYAPNVDDNTAENWREKIGHFLVIKADDDIVDVETKLQSFILDGVHPDTLFPLQLECYRTLNDLGTGLQPSSTQDTLYDDIVLLDPINNLIKVTSNPIPVDSAGSVVVHEEKYNLWSMEISRTGIQPVSVTISGHVSGTVTGVEVRLLNAQNLTVVQDWVLLDNAPTTSFSGTITVTDPNIYHVEARPSNNPNAVFEGRAELVVAPAIAILGQSQMSILLGEYTADKSSLPTVTHGGRGYYINKGVVNKLDAPNTYRNSVYIMQEHWQKFMGDTPVIWVRMQDNGTGHLDWLNNNLGDDSIPIIGDGTFGSGQVSTLTYMINNDIMNFVINWGTSDAGQVGSDYVEQVRGLMFNTGVGYTGVTYKHLNDFFTIGGIGVSGHVRHEDDTAPSAYVSSNDGLRDRQNALWREELINEVSNKIVIGAQNFDCQMDGVSGPHQLAGVTGNGRIATSIGVTAAWLASKRDYQNPKFRNAYISQDGLEIRMPYMSAHGGNVRTVGNGTEVEYVRVTYSTYLTNIPCNGVIDTINEEVVLTAVDGSSFQTIFDTETNVKAYYRAPITGMLDSASQLVELDKILIEEVPYLERGLQFEQFIGDVLPYSYKQKALDHKLIEQTPELVDKTGMISFYPLLNDTLDTLGNTTATTSGLAVNGYYHGLQSVLEQAIDWDGDTLSEVNTDANADGFAVIGNDTLEVIEQPVYLFTGEVIEE